ncbi:MAG TPA: hypothetical protein VGO32_00685 [Candidatus Limnocylindria bacterium]|nr:hypothetical protein [Candidatus Limnocylindria bacterium]
MKRIVAALAVLVAVCLLFGAAPADTGTADPVRVAALQRRAVTLAAEADATLLEAEALMRTGSRDGGRAQAAVLSGDEDPATFADAAALSFESAAGPIDAAREPLVALGWTLLALDPETAPPTLGLTGADLLAIGAQWRATALPLSALAELRRDAEATLTSLGEALAALDDDDPEAALVALAEAEASLALVRAFDTDVSTLPFWIETVDALLTATGDIARAAQAGDAAALAEAQAAYDAAADDAGRADQALTIALGEATTQVTSAATAATAEAIHAVEATRAALAGVSILP